MSEGAVERGAVTCPLHYGQFDLRTGEAVGPPASERLRFYEVKLVDGSVFISLP